MLAVLALLVGPGTRSPLAELVLPPGPPASPRDVLVFWFGREYYADPDGLERADYLRARSRVWFGGGAAVDTAARRFAPLIRAAGRGALGSERAWAERDGLVARLVLLDQLARNAFRGSAEAYAYDARARAQVVGALERGRVGVILAAEPEDEHVARAGGRPGRQHELGGRRGGARGPRRRR